MQDLAFCAPETLASHRSFLYGYALAKLRQPSVAEELVQETFLAAVEGILKHKIIDWMRSEARNPARPSPRPAAEPDDKYEDTCDALFDSAGNWVNPPSAWPNPEQSLENERFWETMQYCLARLPAATARAFYLREIQGLSTEEICTELSISESNCWVMLHRARLSLRQLLEERWFMKDELGAVSSKLAPRIAVAG